MYRLKRFIMRVREPRKHKKKTKVETQSTIYVNSVLKLLD